MMVGTGDGFVMPGSESPLDKPAARPRSRRGLWIALAIGVHALALGGALLVPKPEPKARPEAAMVSQMIEVQLEPEPEPEPEVAPEPETPPPAEPEPPPEPAPKPAPVKAARPVAQAPEPAPEPETAPEPEPPAAAAAEAAKLLVAEAPAATADSIVSGEASTPVGGASAAGGTAKAPVRDPNARADGVEGGTGKAPAPKVDRSRGPRLAAGLNWSCPFPREADLTGVNEAKVLLRIQVASDGSVAKVAVQDDPGDGFGRQARLCALRKRWEPALNADGEPVARVVMVRVGFTR